MKLGIGERMSPCDALWAETEDRRVFAHTNGVEASLDDSSSQGEEESEEEESAPKRKARKSPRARRRQYAA